MRDQLDRATILLDARGGVAEVPVRLSGRCCRSLAGMSRRYETAATRSPERSDSVAPFRTDGFICSGRR